MFTEFIFINSFITFQGKVYIGKEGIPTGNCVSRQVADCAMHWLIFLKVRPQMINHWGNILFWRRYIDDILGLWLGTRRQFDQFVGTLNQLTKYMGYCLETIS